VRAAVTGDGAPGGGSFGLGTLGRFSLNEKGEGAAVFVLDPFLLPFGLNAGVYRYSAGKVSTVVTPFSTPAPGGGVFAGAFGAEINNEGDVVFGGLTETDLGVTPPFGLGVYLGRKSGGTRAVAVPGSPAPGGGVFDFAASPFINDRGDIVFSGHIAGEPCLAAGDQDIQVGCLSGVYLAPGNGGAIRMLAGMGSAVPGGVLKYATSPQINSQGDVLFGGGLTDGGGVLDQVGLFVWRKGTIQRVAGPGDIMPGGGLILTASVGPPLSSISDSGAVAFAATLDLDDDSDGLPDTGLYIWDGSATRLLVRSGMEVPGVGVVWQLQAPALIGLPRPQGGAVINSKGEVLTQVTTTDFRGYLLVAHSQ
jgi:hypothetical protein